MSLENFRLFRRRTHHRPPVTIRTIFVGLVLMLTPLVADAAGFQVAPSRFVFSIDKRYTNYFTVTNNTTDPIRVRIYPKFVDFDADGRAVEREQHPHSLSKWLVFNPRRVSLRPRQRRVIRFSVRPPPGLEPGEFRTVVFFEELPAAPRALKEKNKGAKPEGVSLSLSLLTRLGITLYGTVGERTHDVSVENESIDMTPTQLNYAVKFVNKGNGHEILDIRGELFSQSMEPVASSEKRYALHRDQSLDWKFTIDRPSSGNYILVLTAHNKTFNLVEHTIPVVVGSQPGG